MTARALKTLLEGLVDYAGLFPPAALSMQDAVRNYARYREEEHAWMLGRFVVPAARVGEVPEEFPLAVVSAVLPTTVNAVIPSREDGEGSPHRARSSPVGGGFLAVSAARNDTVPAGAATNTTQSGDAPAFPLSPPQRGEGRVRGIPVYEIKAASREDVESLADAAHGRTVYVELTDLTLIPLLAQRGLRAKIRTGGITVDAFPRGEAIADFMRACKAAGVAFKATAGLHHPVRCVKPLTYEANAPRGAMHGFLNLFVAAAMLDRAEEILNEEDSRAFGFDDDGVTWRDRRVSTDELAIIRRDFATSFGSCSFEEPIEDLRALGLLT